MEAERASDAKKSAELLASIDHVNAQIAAENLTLQRARGTVRKPVSGHFSAVVAAMVR